MSIVMSHDGEDGDVDGDSEDDDDDDRSGVHYRY